MIVFVDFILPDIHWQAQTWNSDLVMVLPGTSFAVQAEETAAAIESRFVIPLSQV